MDIKAEVIKTIRDSLDAYEKSDNEGEAVGLLLRHVIALIHADTGTDNPYLILGKATRSIFLEMNSFLEEMHKQPKEKDE